MSMTVVAASVHAESVATVRKSLQSTYNKSTQAYQRKDADAACEMYDPDCTIYVQNGDSAGLVSVRDMLGKMMDLFQKISETTNIKSCSIANKDGVESARVSVTDIKYAVIFTPHGKRLAVKDVMARRDYWEKTDDGWKIKQSRILSDVGTVNGKRIDSIDELDLR